MARDKAKNAGAGAASGAGRYPGRCKRCNAMIVFVRKGGGKMEAQNGDGSNHLSTCPFADQLRKMPFQSSLFAS